MENSLSDYWCDVAAAFMDLGDGGCDFIDRVECAVYNRDFMGGRADLQHLIPLTRLDDHQPKRLRASGKINEVTHD